MIPHVLLARGDLLRPFLIYRNLKDEYMLHREELESIPNDADRAKRMTELHVMEGNNTAAVRSPLLLIRC